MNSIERVIAPTPKFFQKLRNIGLSLIAVSAVLVTSPVALPVALVSLANYVSLAGGVMAAISQLTIAKEPEQIE